MYGAFVHEQMQLVLSNPNPIFKLDFNNLFLYQLPNLHLLDK